MRRFAVTVSAALLVLALAPSVALADHHEEEKKGPSAIPVEAFICSFNEGKGAADLDQVVANWNTWANIAGLNDYIGITLTPYYYGPEQMEFDFIWLGASFTAAGLGRAQDTWLATGSESAAEWAELATCASHSNFAALPFKAPPADGPPDTFVMSFSDCSMAEGKTFDDAAPALAAWGEYRAENGSIGGIWAFMPAYGGGGEKYDFKYVATHANLEGLGNDWDQYAAGGYAKAGELFEGVIDCDSSRTYIATTRRRPSPPAEE